MSKRGQKLIGAPQIRGLEAFCETLADPTQEVRRWGRLALV